MLLLLTFYRYFVLDSGLLTYGKNEADIKRGRTQGRINVGTAIISAKTEMFRIDIDDEECIHHLKVILSLITVLIIRVYLNSFHC